MNACRGNKKKKKKNKMCRQIIRIQIPETATFIAIKFRTGNSVEKIWLCYLSSNVIICHSKNGSTIHHSPFKQYSSIWHSTLLHSNTTNFKFICFFLLFFRWKWLCVAHFSFRGLWVLVWRITSSDFDSELFYLIFYDSLVHKENGQKERKNERILYKRNASSSTEYSQHSQLAACSSQSVKILQNQIHCGSKSFWSKCGFPTPECRGPSTIHWRNGKAHYV